jgi:hypothetical protein
MKLGKLLNESFDHVYVKNMSDAKKRLKSFEDSASLIDLTYEVYKAIEGTKYVPQEYEIKYRPELYPIPANQYLVGNLFTTMSIFLDAMRKSYESIVICDDDVVFYDYDFTSIKKDIPIDWDIIILGSSIENIKREIDRSNNIELNFLKMSYGEAHPVSGCHCTAFSKKAYWKYMIHLLNFDTHGRFGDVIITDMSAQDDMNIYITSTDVCFQDREKLKPYVIE